MQISQYCEFANVLNQSLEEEALSVWIFLRLVSLPQSVKVSSVMCVGDQSSENVCGSVNNYVVTLPGCKLPLDGRTLSTVKGVDVTHGCGFHSFKHKKSFHPVFTRSSRWMTFMYVLSDRSFMRTDFIVASQDMNCVQVDLQ